MAEQPLSQDQQNFIVEGHSLPRRRGDVPVHTGRGSISTSALKPRTAHPLKQDWLPRRLEKNLDLLDQAEEQLRRIVPTLRMRDANMFDRARNRLTAHLADLEEFHFLDESNVGFMIYQSVAVQLCKMVQAVTGDKTQSYPQVWLPEEHNLHRDDRSSALRIDFAIRRDDGIGEVIYVAEIKLASVLDYHLGFIERDVYDVDVDWKPKADRSDRGTWAESILAIVLKTATSAAARNLEYAVIISETKFIPLRIRRDINRTTGASGITVEVGNYHEVLPTSDVGPGHPRSRYISFLFFLHLNGLGYGQAPSINQAQTHYNALGVAYSGNLVFPQPSTSASPSNAVFRTPLFRSGGQGSDRTIRGLSLMAPAPIELILDFGDDDLTWDPAAQLVTPITPRSPAIDSGYGSSSSSTFSSTDFGESSVIGPGRQATDSSRKKPSHKINVATPRLAITKVLGSGAVGSVYEGQLCGARVAVKVAKEDDQEAQEDLEGEVEILQILAARGVQCVPRLHGYYRYANGDGFIVMSYCGQEVEGGKRWDDLGIATRKSIYNAHKKIHDAGIVHNDLRPDNVLMDDDGQINIVDFHMSYDHTCSDKCKALARAAAVLHLKKDDIDN